MSSRAVSPVDRWPRVAALSAWLDLLWTPLLGCVVASVVALVRRFRRSRGVERLQLRWLTPTSGQAAASSGRRTREPA